MRCLLCSIGPRGSRTEQLIICIALATSLGALASCVLSEDLPSSSHTETAAECFEADDCSTSDLCFLSRCVDAGFTLTSVGAEASPPSGSGFLRQTIPSTINLNAGFQELALTRTITVEGTIRSEGEAVVGIVEASIPLDPRCNPPLPNRGQIYRSTPTELGYALQVPAGLYLLRFVPDDNNLPPVVLEAGAECGVQLENDGQLSVIYPAAEDRMILEGRLQAAENGSVGVLGARVSGVGTTPSGLRVESTTTFSASDGSFSLVFPAPVRRVDLVVGPGELRLVPHVVFEGLVVEDGRLQTQSLSLRPLLNVSLELTGLNDDGEATEVTDAVAVFQGEVGNGILSFDTANGTAQLPPGDYVLTVVPPVTSPLALTSSHITVNSNTQDDAGRSNRSVDIAVHLPNRVMVSGSILTSNDDVVAGAALVFISVDAPFSRSFRTVTGEDGGFGVLVDPPSLRETINYDVIIEPPRELGLPRSRQQVRLTAETSSLVLRLSRSSFVFGRVVGEDGRPVPDTLLRFFSLDLPPAGAPPLEIGATQTGDDGNFAVPLPIHPE